MSLKLILGSSGSGKSYKLYNDIISNSLKNPLINYIVIVPEQFTMQVQKRLLSMHPDKGTMNIEILSFTRLAFEVFDELGISDKIILDETGKSMVLRKSIELNKKELKVFSNNIKKAGFVNELKSFISELYQYDIDSQKLTNALSLTKDKALLNNKLKDVLTIYNAFKDYLKNKFITVEEIFSLLRDMISKSNLIKNSYIYLDEFASFSPLQYKIIKQLIEYSKDVTISITIDTSEAIYKIEEEYKLFNISQTTISKLLKVDSINHDKRNDLIIKAKIPYRFRNSKALAHLEKNIFRYPFGEFTDTQNEISIHALNTQNDEIEYVLQQILILVHNNNYRYRDIAIITGNLEIYESIIENLFNKNDIPYFIDRKKSIISNQFVEFIRSSLDVIIKDFSYNSIFRYLRSGLTGIEDCYIDIVENYCLALGIKGYSKWNNKWERKPRKSKEIDLELLNDIRFDIMNPLTTLRATLKAKNSTVRDFTRGLWNLILECNIESQLSYYTEDFLQNNELLLAEQYKQIYKAILDLLDKIVELLGDEIVSIQEYAEILDSGFEEIKMGLIPPSIDQIIVGDIKRTRLNEIKVLFFVGVNDGIIPSFNDKGGIISDLEKQILLENGIELSPTSRQLAYSEKFYLYSSLTIPSDSLYILFSKLGANGKSINPSYLIGTLLKLFPKLEVKNQDLNKDINSIQTSSMGIEYLIDGLKKYKAGFVNSEWEALYNWYYTDDNWKPKILKLVEAAFYMNKEKGLTKSVAKALYGDELNGNISRLEQYARCAYSHFLKYGLELYEREKFAFSAPDMGNILHMVIDLFSKKLVDLNKDWISLLDDERDKLVELCVTEVTDKYKEDILQSSFRNKYIINRINRISKRTIWVLQEHLKRGNFNPNRYEIQFSNIDNLNSIDIALTETEKVKLDGKIDRIDEYNNENKVYIKIINYKTSQNSFDIVSLYYGFELKLAVYMNAALELEKTIYKDKTVIPAGMFYYNIDDPIIDKSESEDINKLILDKLKLDGLVNKDPDIIRSIDKNFKDSDKASEVIPLGNSTITTDYFKYLTKFANKKVIAAANKILNGDIKPNPFKTAKDTACKYCKYKSICCFDSEIDGNEYNKVKKYKPDEIWNFISKEIDGDDNNVYN